MDIAHRWAKRFDLFGGFFVFLEGVFFFFFKFCEQMPDVLHRDVELENSLKKCLLIHKCN